jgi:hypothetical protein
MKRIIFFGYGKKFAQKIEEIIFTLIIIKVKKIKNKKVLKN